MRGGKEEKEEGKGMEVMVIKKKKLQATVKSQKRNDFCVDAWEFGRQG